MEPLTLRFKFDLPNNVKATVIQDVQDARSTVNYEHLYDIYNYGSRIGRPDVISTLTQRIHASYQHGKLSNKLVITYGITNERLEEELHLFDSQTLPAQEKASLDFTYIKEDGDEHFKLASIHRGITEIFSAGNGSGYSPSLGDLCYDLRAQLVIRDGHAEVPLISAKFERFDAQKVPLELA